MIPSKAICFHASVEPDVQICEISDLNFVNNTDSLAMAYSHQNGLEIFSSSRDVEVAL